MHFSLRNLKKPNSSNKIHEVNAAQLFNNRKLATFDISYNNFEELDSEMFAELVELKHLNITGNPVIKVTERHLRNLYNVCNYLFLIKQSRKLFFCFRSPLSNCPILEGNEWFILMFQLETLRLCDMEELVRLPEPHSFRNLRHLRNLYVIILTDSYHLMHNHTHL